MASVFDYLDWRGDITFSEVGLSEVDSLILSSICYVDFDSIVPEEFNEKPVSLRAAARQYLTAHKGEQAYIGAIIPPATLKLLAKAAKTKRFAGIGLVGYVNHVDSETQKQFSALSYLLDDGTLFVAYRGTDDSLVGWKENFNMSFMEAIPAQLEAVEYIKSAAALTVGRIFVGGHSKGGNLAVYATVKAPADVKERIVLAYSNDGPGFSRKFIDSADYQSIKAKIRTIIPQSSVVGMLLEHEDTYEVVKSNQTGLMQHDSFSWEVLGNSFVRLDGVTEESRSIDRTLKGWLSEMDAKQREEFVDAIYETLSATNATTLTDISTDKIKLLRAYNNLSDENKNIVTKSIKLLLKETVKRKK